MSVHQCKPEIKRNPLQYSIFINMTVSLRRANIALLKIVLSISKTTSQVNLKNIAFERFFIAQCNLNIFFSRWWETRHTFKICLKENRREVTTDSAGASEERVISETEHQKGRVIPLCKLFKGKVTHLFQIFVIEDFCNSAFHFSYRLSYSFYLLWFNLVFYYRF